MARQSEDNYATVWPVRHRPRDVIDLLTRVLDCAPKLAGAACRDMPPTMFDPDQIDQAAQAAAALEVCDQCPALQTCQTWAQSQPRSALSGIVGGIWWLDPRSTAAAAAS